MQGLKYSGTVPDFRRAAFGHELINSKVMVMISRRVFFFIYKIFFSQPNAARRKSGTVPEYFNPCDLLYLNRNIKDTFKTNKQKKQTFLKADVVVNVHHLSCSHVYQHVVQMSVPQSNYIANH